MLLSLSLLLLHLHHRLVARRGRGWRRRHCDIAGSCCSLLLLLLLLSGGGLVPCGVVLRVLCPVLLVLEVLGVLLLVGRSDGGRVGGGGSSSDALWRGSSSIGRLASRSGNRAVG